jgi:hypothetical protein
MSRNPDNVSCAHVPSCAHESRDIYSRRFLKSTFYREGHEEHEV